MTDEREQERLRAALHEAAEPGSRGIDVDAVLSGSRRRRRPRVALAGGALAVALIASGAGLAGGLLPQAAVMTASDTSDPADAPAATAESFSADGGAGSGDELAEGQPQVRSGADVCAAPDAALAADRGITVGTPPELERDGATTVTVGGDAALQGELVVESIALLDAGRVAAVLLGADGAGAVDVPAGGTTEVAVQGALIGCGDGPPPPGDYEAVATIRLIAENGATSTLRSAPQSIALR